MKRIIAAALLTIFILALSFYGKWATQDSILLIQRTMEQIDIELANGDTEHALQQSEDFMNEWDKHHSRMCLFRYAFRISYRQLKNNPIPKKIGGYAEDPADSGEVS